MSPHSRAILGIDASNIRAGGGLTHLVELLRAADPPMHGFDRVIVWGGRRALSQIDDRDWLVKAHQPELDRGVIHRSLWQRFALSRAARAEGCTMLFIPGGSYAGDFRPVVAFNQNLLPFQWRELRRFGWRLTTLKFVILRAVQSRTFRRADGVIFLTQYARDVVMRVIGRAVGATAVVPHGTEARFTAAPRAQCGIGDYSTERPYRILYVSQVNVYKHQWNVADAISLLRLEGLPVELELVGPSYPPALRRLNQTLDRVDPSGVFIHYEGAVPYDELSRRYAAADLFVFASSCETFGQILTEAMAAGLPIACSSQPALRELLAGAGVYFDPENPVDIARALRELILSPETRARAAREAFERSQSYSWDRCAASTLDFLAAARQPEDRNGRT